MTTVLPPLPPPALRSHARLLHSKFPSHQPITPYNRFTGDLFTTVGLFANDPLGLLIVALVGCSTFVGVSIYMVLVSQYSGVAVVFVSTVRKVVTVVLRCVTLLTKSQV